jgi:acyl-CoA:6-aminopenicillanic acid acyl transferase
MNEFPFVEARGSAFQMGLQHGRQAEPLIRKYLEWIEKLTGLQREQLRRNALRFLPYIRKLSPHYVEEIFGLAEGARLEMADAVLCQARAEAAHRWDSACTAFALTGRATADGYPLAGQNQDLESEYADVAIVLHVQPEDGRPPAIMFTFAGQLGYAGMNHFGVCNFVNALYNFQWRPALPYYPLRRVLLEQSSVDGCIRVLRRHPACSAANFVMADGQGKIADVECRPEGMAIYPDHDPDARLHTNHYVTREFAKCEDGTLPDSQPRLARVQALVRKSWGSITVDTMKEILADHDGGASAICRHGGVRMHSVAGYIAEPAKGLLHVRCGHGCDGNWKSYRV